MGQYLNKNHKKMRLLFSIGRNKTLVELVVNLPLLPTQGQGKEPKTWSEKILGLKLLYL